MGKKILFAVMALLVMATGKIGAQTPYALLCQNGTDDQGVTACSMHFVYTSATVNTGGGEITVGGGSNGKKLTYTKAWEVPTSGEILDMPENWTNNPDGITQVVFEESFKDFEVTDCSNWFDGFKNLTEIIGIENLNTSKVTNMAWMFNGCEKLESLDLSNFNTSGAAYTASMFKGCSSLKQITFGNNFKTSNTGSMFKGCSSLTSLVLSSFVTSQVTDMSDMFNSCKALKSLDLRSFNTSEVTNMSSMFSNCGKLESLDLSSFNTSNVENMNSMFSDCSKLTTLTLGCFYMRHMRTSNNMFDEYNNITIKGNALVFLESDDQKEIWKNITGVRLMVKKDGAYEYEGNGTVDIILDNDTPVIFPDIFTANSVTFTRKFTAGNPHTVCLPFAITNTTDYGTFYELSGYDKDNRRVKFTKVDATKANKPYLFIPDKNKADVTKIEVKGDVDIYSTIYGEYGEYVDDNTCFICVYDKLTFTAEFLAENSGYDYYGWTADGSFKRATAGASVAPCRAYIRLAKETTGSGSAPARLSVEFDDGETTGIDTIGTAESGANSGADAPMYNLQGQRVGSGYKGVVIKNGKKMIVR